MPVIKYLQLPFFFDTTRLQEEVQLLSGEHWRLHYQEKHYEGEWSALPLRSTGGRPDDIIIAPTSNESYADTVFLEKSPYLRSVLSSFECPLQAVRLLKLDAGAVIREHRDAELNYENGEIRLHIPVITHEAVDFNLDGDRMQLKEGECWYMNFNLPHSIVNNSPVNRIHLVIDAIVNDWVKELFSNQSLNRKETEAPFIDEETQRRIIAQLRELNTETGNRLADEMEAALSPTN